MENEGRVRLLRLLELLKTQSDAKHPISTPELIRLLKEKWGLDAYRITVQRDIEALTAAGYDVRTIHSKQNKYYLAGRTFEEPELKLLLDAVASARFITHSNSKLLAAKLLSLTNVQRAAVLQRHVSLTDRIKPKNESIYAVVDTVNRAINEKRKISFLYFYFTAAKRKRLRNNGDPYRFSPYTLIWNGDRYYMVGWSDKHQKLAAFRLDRVLEPPMLLQEDAVPKPKDFSIGEYSEKAFQLFDGTRAEVELLCHECAMNSVLDHFGDRAKTRAVDDTHFRLTTEVSLSPTFYAWVCQFGGKVILQGPEQAVQEYKLLLHRALRQSEEPV